MRGPICCLLLALGASSCTGDGSDIGPGIEPLPDASLRVLVKDAEGRGVASARVTMPAVGEADGATGRDGRVDLFVPPAGLQQFHVDGGLASAASGDLLGSLAFVSDVPTSRLLPFVVHLPDLAGSAGLDLSPGVLGGDLVLDDTGWSGAVVALVAGTVVDLGGSATAVLRTGQLRADRIPPLTPAAITPVLASRGILVEPANASFVPAAVLSLPNELGLAPGATAELFRLDPADGAWKSVAVATVVDGGARLTADRAVPGGGLYAAAVTAPAHARLFGRIVRVGTTDSLRLLRLRAGQVVTLSDDSGGFVLDQVPVTDAAGAAVPVVLQIAGGLDQRPLIEEISVDAAPGADVDLGQLESGISYSIDLRLQLVRRGRVEVDRSIGIGTTETGSGGVGVSRPDGRIDFPAVEEGVVGFLTASPDSRNIYKVRAAEGLLTVYRRRSWDLQVFFDDQDWRPDTSTLIWAVDAELRGPIAGVHVFRNRGQGDEFIVVTRPDQIERLDVRYGEVVLTSETTIEGQTFRSAFAVQEFDSGRLEATLPRASRAPLGAFERFGRVTGDVSGAGPDRSVHVTVPTNVDRWFDAVLGDRSLDATTPVLVEPSRDGGTAFDLGVPSTGGTVIAASIDPAGGRARLVDLAFRSDVTVGAATRTALDLGPAVAADTEFVVLAALTGLDPRIASDTLVFDLGIRVASGRVLDAVRGAGANITERGQELAFALPALEGGELAGGRHLLWLRGRAEDAGAVLEQAALLQFDSTAAAAPARGFLGTPRVDAPVPGALLSFSAGLDVTYELPGGALFGLVTLRSAPGDPPREWTFLVPADSTSVRFRPMPSGPEVLAPGRYSLEVTAVRLSPDSPLVPLYLPYQIVASRRVGVRPASLGYDATSSVSFEVELGS